MKIYFIIILLAAFVAGCQQLDVYEKTIPFPKHEWAAAEKPTFNFTITDTAAHYNVFIVLRHGDAYHFNNLWMDITTIPPGDTVQTVRANLKLGDNQKWLGNTIDDIVEHRILINTNPLKFKAGNYKFMLQQVMRENPLQYVLNAGIRVEKVTP
ncbi:gliding motility lipoprotein GldH [Ilyomonas limi]|uniref:gliding motility lipoprotein GldH n=1 Tax=Ilyomonas limi TaxID=2575867 RepID=UPI001484EBBD|nr:gliding motility lipoprotein GldH [Ilyomonas limi]